MQEATNLELRRLEAEIGAAVLRKRDLEIELKGLNQAIDALTKQYDAAKAGK